MTVQELGQQTKSKYPQYQNLPDDQVGSLVLKKYPQYQAQIDQPPKGQTGLTGFGVGAGKGIFSTLTGASSLGERVLRGTVGQIPRLFGGVGQKQPERTAAEKIVPEGLRKPQGTAENIGFGAEQIGEFLVPGATSLKLSKAASGAKLFANTPRFAKGAVELGTRALAEAGLAGGQTALQQGKVNQQVGMNTAFAGALPIAGAALKGIGNVAKESAKFVSSKLSGVPTSALEYTFKNPRAVQSAVKKFIGAEGEEGIQKIHQSILSSLDELKNARSEAYQKSLEELEKGTTKTKGGQLYIKRLITPKDVSRGMAAEQALGRSDTFVPTNLSTNGIKNVFTRTAKEFGAEGGGKGGLNFTNVALDDTHISKLQKLQQRIYNWTDVSPTGVNKLRQVVDSYKVGGINLGSSEAKFNKIIGDLRTNLADYLGERVPQIKEMNRVYALQSEVINKMKQELNLATKNPQTSMRKLLNVFNPKSSVYAPLVKELGEKTGKDFMADVAGLMMSKWTPEGLGAYLTTGIGGAIGALSLANPSALVTLPAGAVASSPRILGSLVRTASKVSGTLQKTPQPLKTPVQRIFGR